jgi:two-component system chemotaxis response regulator CheB
VTQETETRATISILVVDDSAFMRSALSRMINSDPALNVVGTAKDGTEALAQIAALNPDVVTLDVEMPGLNGLETLRRVMAQSPRPVIMVSSSTEKEAQITFTALGAGAYDYVPKRLSSTTLSIDHVRTDLIAKIKSAAQWARQRRKQPLLRKPPSTVLPAQSESSDSPHTIVVIGTSMGGPQALQQILPALPADLSVPILIVQHMPPGFTATFAQRLNTLCSVPVRQATHNEIVRPGVVYLAPAGIHMQVLRSSTSHVAICLAPQPDGYSHIPSVDVLMESVASTFGNLTMGVIMTGMGSDGLMGMKAIHRMGGFTLGQDEDTCMAYGMPRACAEAGILKNVVPLSQIPTQILRAIQYRKPA